MKVNKIIYVFLLLPLMVMSCSDYLEVKDQSSINPSIWDNEESAKLYLNYIYSAYLTPFGGNQDIAASSLTGLSDDVATTPNNLLIGTLTAGNVSYYSGTTYQLIRYVNIGIDAAKKSNLDAAAKARTLGQLYFFRAWFHWRLVNLYGGVPYMRSYVTMESPDTVKNVPRTSTSQCISYLKEDLDSAINMLPSAWVSTEYSRITRAAAAAFKGRILLFYASPQFNPDHNLARWKDAYAANLFARDLCLQDGYSLMSIAGTNSQSPYSYDFNKIFMTKKSNGNPEVLLVTPYYTDIKMHGYENSVCPNEITTGTGAPSNCPSWDLVISFPMKDGSLAFKYNAANKNSRIFTGNGGDMTKYYLNRDPRFYSTVAFNGSNYQLEGNAARRQWTYNCPQKVNGTTSTYYAENTTQDKTSTTGFYCRKMVDPNLVRANYGKSITDWIEMRYAEVLLNLAECAFETGDADKYSVGMDCLEQIRSRAGIDPGTDGTYGISGNLAAGFTPVEVVMNERRVEFAFEGKRFYDLRRRNMFTEDLGPNILKLNGWKISGSGFTFTLKNVADTTIFLHPERRDTIKFANLYKYFTLNAKSTGPFVKALNYICVRDSTSLKATTSGNYNFFDIPTDIIARSPNVLQNYGWQNGAFNPFQ